MNKFILALAALLKIGSVFGQESEATYNTKHTILILIGVASPGSEFSEKDFDEEESGFAQTGVALGLDYQYNFHTNLGATFMIRSLAYPYDVDALLGDAQDLFINTNYTIESEAYGVGFIGLGVIGEIGNDVVKACLNPFIGLSSLIYPEQIITTQKGTTRGESEIESTIAKNLIYGAGFGAKFRLSELIGFSLNFEYATAIDYELKTKINYSDNQGNRSSMESEYDQPFSTFNTTVKLSFNF